MNDDITVVIRPRKICPECTSVQISRRVKLGGYRCGKCGWIGDKPDMVKRSIRQDAPKMPGKRDGHVHRKYAVGIACSERVSDDRIDRIRKLKDENPNSSQRMIAVLALDSEYAVRKALKGYTPQVVAE